MTEQKIVVKNVYADGTEEIKKATGDEYLNLCEWTKKCIGNFFVPISIKRGSEFIKEITVVENTGGYIFTDQNGLPKECVSRKW